MEIYAVSGLTFFYPEQAAPALDGLSFSIESGQFVVIAGASGCGKTTLLRQLKTALSPHGSLTGEIRFCGRLLSDAGQREQSEKIGFVLQSPENQIVTDKVWHELAFGLESLGCDTPTIRARVAEMAAFFGIEHWFHSSVAELSGGQKQLLSLAAIMTMQPQVLILDEPTSRLDPIAAEEFISVLGKINRDLGTTVMLSGHCLDAVLPLADRVLAMDCGKLVHDCAPRELGQWLKATGHPLLMSMPTPMRVYAAVANDLPCPLTVRDGRGWLEAFSAQYELLPPCARGMTDCGEKTVISMRDVWFRYGRSAPNVLRGMNLCVKHGEIFAIVGSNGAGKSTALSLIAGLVKPQSGDVTVHGRIALLPQESALVFAGKTVIEDLREMKKKDDADFEQRLAGVLELCRLEELLSRHPFDLSGGETQRAALAKVLLACPDILLLDEPTKGMDAESKAELSAALLNLSRGGTTIVIVSHDLDFCAENAHRCALLFDGGIVSQGTPEKLFGGNSFFTTAANRMARGRLPQAVTVSDVILSCGGAYHN